MHKVYLLTGSNQGQSREILKEAALRINQRIGKTIQTSQCYKTSAWGNTNQPAFLNQVLAIETELTAHHVLKIILDIEEELGRVREQKWEPRLIDIDLLMYDQIVLSGNLNIPHPLLQERRFVLVPFNEIAPNLLHPVFQKTIHQLLLDCNDNGNVEVFKSEDYST